MAAVVVLLLGLFLYLLIWAKAEWPAGGEDSWNHFLYARWCLKHPELMLDQWGKPFFTIPAIPFALFGLKGLYVFNILCCLGAGHLCYLTAKRMGMRLPWMAAVFFLFQPVVFGNVVSGLTEPVNALFLSWIFYCFVSQRTTQGAILASFLPFFRSEGFIILIAIGLFLLVRRKWKQLPALLTGALLYTLILGITTGDWLALINQNPYIKHETSGGFDPGHGNFFHYLNGYRQIWGLVAGLLLVMAFLYLAAHVVYLLKKRTPEERSRFAFWLFAPVFLSFFLAHSYIWWAGSMGSHGLLRVFLVVAPAVALLAHYAFDRILAIDIRLINRYLPILVTVAAIYIAYKGSNIPFPWKSVPSIPGYAATENVHKALAFIHEKNLGNKVTVHMLPFVNAEQGWDPWETPEKAKTFYCWSIDDQHPEKDWMPDSTVVIWDGFHSPREGTLPLQAISQLPAYHELAVFPSEDSIYEVRVFIKSKTNK